MTAPPPVGWAPRGAWLLVACVLATLSGCDSAPAALEVGEVEYTEQELGALTPGQRQRLGLLTAFALATADARLDLVAQPLVRQERDSLLIERLVLEQAARASGLDEAGLRAAYRDDPEYRLTVRHIVVLAERWRAPDERAAARARAAAARQRVLAGEDFGRVAAQVSEEPAAPVTGGLLEPGTRASWVPEFWEAASRLDEEELSGVVETRYGYHVLRLVARDTVPFDSVRYDVLPRLMRVVSSIPATRAALERERISLGEGRLVEKARDLGVSTTAAEDERIRSRWMGHLTHLAAVFEFGPDVAGEAVKLAAMRALGDQRQSVRIALAALVELEAALGELYEIRLAAPDTGPRPPAVDDVRSAPTR